MHLLVLLLLAILLGLLNLRCEQRLTLLWIGVIWNLNVRLYWQTKKTAAETLEDLETPEVLQMLNRLKSTCRSDINALFEAADKQDKADLIEKLKETNKPHEMGTVSEIAEKFGISKSEVRRRKADGTLHELKEV